MEDSPMEFFSDTMISDRDDGSDYVIEIGTQGLTKKILSKGDSWTNLYRGDDVKIHYTGLVGGGLCFDSSRDRGTPFSFKLGQGEVIKGLDIGIATMKMGERSIFTVPPNLAYGKKGCPPHVPPNSTLLFDIKMLSCIGIRDLLGNGAVMKKTIREGEGWDTPGASDEVLVKYEARLENGKFVSKVEGVEFSCCDGSINRAFEIAVKTMRKGEKAELWVKYFYGIEPQVGDDATRNWDEYYSNQIIDLELLSWKSVISITEDTKVTKKIIKKGEGYNHPCEGSVVRVIYICTHEDGKVIEMKGSYADPYELVCFEEQIHEGLFKSILTMREGEKSIVTIKSHGKKTLLYELELISFTKEMPSWKMTNTQKLLASEKKMEEGYNLFRARRFWCAFLKCEGALKCLEVDHSFTDEEKAQANELRIICSLNCACSKLELGDYKEAEILCTKVLECYGLNPNNVTALYLRSKSYAQGGKLNKSIIDLMKALSIEPNNSYLINQKEDLNAMMEAQKEFLKEGFDPMFERLNLHSEKKMKITPTGDVEF